MSRWYTLNSQTGIYSGPLIDALRLGLAGVGLSTVAWAFTTPSAPPPVVASSSSSSDHPSEPSSTSDARAVSSWMRRASEEGKDGTSVATALENVGPWAKDQRAGDNAVPARAPTPRHNH